MLSNKSTLNIPQIILIPSRHVFLGLSHMGFYFVAEIALLPLCVTQGKEWHFVSNSTEAVKNEVQKEPNNHFFGYNEIFKILEIEDSC